MDHLSVSFLIGKIQSIVTPSNTISNNKMIVILLEGCSQLRLPSLQSISMCPASWCLPPCQSSSSPIRVSPEQEDRVAVATLALLRLESREHRHFPHLTGWNVHCRNRQQKESGNWRISLDLEQSWFVICRSWKHEHLEQIYVVSTEGFVCWQCRE